MRSWSNRALAVRRVTQNNQGKPNLDRSRYPIFLTVPYKQ
ncbi:reverse transcriptase N-terminal domain-containing protein [Cylindrospermopsis raciborskii]